jgi:hypothetical protein
MDRIVELHVSANDLTTIAEAIQSHEHVWTALGYLSTWNLTFPKVSIFRDGGSDSTDFIAVYYTATGERGYVIAAVWHDTHYGYHS